MRKIVKKILAHTFYCLHGARIFYFHSIHPEHEHANTPEVFTGMMRYLSESGKVSHTMADITHKLNQKSISENSVAVTFDDGFLDNYEYAFPVLLELGVKATFYVIAGLIENKVMKLKRPIYEG